MLICLFRFFLSLKYSFSLGTVTKLDGFLGSSSFISTIALNTYWSSMRPFTNLAARSHRCDKLFVFELDTPPKLALLPITYNEPKRDDATDDSWPAVEATELADSLDLDLSV